MGVIAIIAMQWSAEVRRYQNGFILDTSGHRSSILFIVNHISVQSFIMSVSSLKPWHMLTWEHTVLPAMQNAHVYHKWNEPQIVPTELPHARYGCLLSLRGTNVML